VHGRITHNGGRSRGIAARRNINHKLKNVGKNHWNLENHHNHKPLSNWDKY
jgi:hypothetical protein